MEMHAEYASHVVTSTHRIMVNRGGTQAAPASSLRKGDSVLCRGMVAKTVLAVRTFRHTVDVFQVAFDPDEPIESFLPPRDVILSLGHPRMPSHTWRGGMRPRAASPHADDQISLPNTITTFG